MERKRIGIGLSVVASAALALTACGGAPIAGGGGSGASSESAKAFEEYGALKGDERRDTLVEAAKEEGKVSLYTSLTGDLLDELEPAFEEDTGVELEVYRADSSDVVTKIAQEQRAGTAGADVVETDSLQLFGLEKLGALSDYSGERRDMVGEQGQFDGWTATRYNVFVPSWNTDAVSESEAPKTWEDLADPKWDGRMALELEDYDWYMALTMYWQDEGKSDDEIAQLWKDIVDGAEVQKGHITMADLQQAGKFDLSADNYSYIVQQHKDAGGPLDFKPMVEPGLERANGVGLIQNAPHPAGAMLFADWLLEEGQEIMASQEFVTAIVPEGAEDPLEGAEVIPLDDQELLNNSEKWSKEYEDLLRGAAPPSE